jgi:hypothetical protein
LILQLTSVTSTSGRMLRIGENGMSSTLKHAVIFYLFFKD